MTKDAKSWDDTWSIIDQPWATVLGYVSLWATFPRPIYLHKGLDRTAYTRHEANTVPRKAWHKSSLIKIQ